MNRTIRLLNLAERLQIGVDKKESTGEYAYAGKVPYKARQSAGSKIPADCRALTEGGWGR